MQRPRVRRKVGNQPPASGWTLGTKSSKIQLFREMQLGALSWGHREKVSRGWWGVWDSGNGALVELARAQRLPSFPPDPQNHYHVSSPMLGTGIHGCVFAFSLGQSPELRPNVPLTTRYGSPLVLTCLLREGRTGGFISVPVIPLPEAAS